MNYLSGFLLVLIVAIVGVLHTVVPDHWVPITLLARQRGWSKSETARAAFQAGTGHVVTTLIIGLIVWAASAGFAIRFGDLVDVVASIGLIAFGLVIGISAWRNLHGNRGHGHKHNSLFSRHGHAPHENHGHTSMYHGPELQRINIENGYAELSIFEEGVPPHFRFTGPAVDAIRVETLRENGTRQIFSFANLGAFWESLNEIPEPHGFVVFLTLRHGGHEHTHTCRFAEHEHGHDHGHEYDDDAATDPLYAPLGGETAVLVRHAHLHRHGPAVHLHWHDHEADAAHEVTETDSVPPIHTHQHKTGARTALILILGSSPMVEGIPAFFAASRYGVALIALMALVFAASTISTYVILCVTSAAGLQRIKLGPVERYGEVISGAFIALVGLVFSLWHVP